jgi:indolepyruvate ferredoxin oxidoreductase beta subunit
MAEGGARNILIVGVGGQGTLLAGRVIGNLAASRGYDVKVSEVHGMAQRGGSVVTYVKYSEAVASPLIENGEADILISFELLEASRWIDWLKPSGKAIVNSQKIDPMPVIEGIAKYTDNLEGILKKRREEIAIVDALSIAEECGSTRSVNFALLGAASTHMDFTREEWLDCIKEVTPQKALSVNIAAFVAGASLTGASPTGASPDSGGERGV